ncbi:MAG: endolytic transglycosylase MltG [Pseudomonadota bacterium]
MKKLVILFLVGLTIAAIGAGGGYLYLQRFAESPMAVSDSSTLDLLPGTSVSKLADNLAQRGWLESPKLLVLYTKWRGDTARLRAGEYDIPASITPKELLDLLIEGQVKLHTVTIVEGWTFRQMLEALHDQQAIEPSLLGLSDEEIMSKLGYEGQHPEGRFFPDTYRFPKGSADTAILKQAYERMEGHLSEAWKERAENLPLDSPYDALTLASIVEKETGLDSERPEIAGVFVRRLKKNMRLQTDPTVIYGMGDAYDGNIRRSDLTRDTPYNTYTRGGLTPTPIALPGLRSIEAVMHPAEGTSLYFVATGKGDGSHHFSDTLDEHERAVQRYLVELRKRRRQSQ